MEEPAEIRRGRGAALLELAKEDLDLFGVEELNDRIEALQAEIDRAKARIRQKEAGRSAADAFFTRKD